MCTFVEKLIQHTLCSLNSDNAYHKGCARLEGSGEYLGLNGFQMAPKGAQGL